MRKGNSDPLSPELEAELRALEARPAPEAGPDDAAQLAAWRRDAERGRFYRPRKVSRTLRIDADVVDFFERQGPGYQTRINAALRRAMLAGEAEAEQQAG